MFSGWCVYHIESHETYFMLRASEAEVVVIVFIVVPGSAMRPTSLSAHQDVVVFVSEFAGFLGVSLVTV